MATLSKILGIELEKIAAEPSDIAEIKRQLQQLQGQLGKRKGAPSEARLLAGMIGRGIAPALLHLALAGGLSLIPATREIGELSLLGLPASLGLGTLWGHVYLQQQKIKRLQELQRIRELLEAAR